MLQRVAATLDHGSIGAFHELIPEGLCFVQLWSSAVFVRGAIEDLLGMDVRAQSARPGLRAATAGRVGLR